MKSGEIPDVNIKASSFYDTRPPEYGRLDAPTSWTIGISVSSPWIQADIGYQTNVSGVITQGAGGGGRVANWVTSLKVSTFKINDTGDAEEFVRDDNGLVKVNYLH